MKFRTVLFALSILALPAAAWAQPVNGVYVSLGGGFNLIANSKDSIKRVTAAGVTVPTNANKIQFNNGEVAVASVGYGFGNGWRVELEGDFYHNGLDELRLTSGAKLPASGNENKFGVMANGFYDFDISVPWLFPYVGAGIGYQWAHLVKAAVLSPPATVGFSTRDSASSFAAQAILGLAMPIPNVPGLSLTAEYRFLALLSDRKYNAAVSIGGAAPVPGSIKVSDEFNHSILVGLRYAFGVSPPPPPPPPAPAPAPAAAAPAPAPAKTFLVFFDWDKSDLTARARQIIADAAQASTTERTTRIFANGYTDTSGTPEYNMGLSIRRADSVAAELVRDGVPEDEIVIKGYGETHLLVPTGPGVREPQNRRVEIILQ